MKTRPKPRHFDSLEQEAFLNLWRTYDRLRTAEGELFERFGLTPQQYNALRLLRGNHPESCPTLVLQARLVSRAPDITRMVDHLESRGWIERRRAGDRRVVQVAITDAGLKLLTEMDEPVRECHHRQLGHLSRAQLEQLVTLLQAARQPHEQSESHWSNGGATASPSS
ncbi:MAG: MarR family transcriptional regulator [Planctomycetes bacterium]|nr:MarR family transcriptional regulator [Planctomycetota bacterium]